MQFTSLLLAVTVTLLYVVLIPDAGKCGISGLHKWFRARFPSAVREIHKRDVVETDHLLFDLNQLLYQVILPHTLQKCGPHFPSIMCNVEYV